jgi:hypothetical protein
MFNAIYDVEAGKSAEINNEIKQKAQMLIEQLGVLQLDNGTTERAVKMLAESLQR